MAQGRDSLALHFTWVLDPEAVRPVVADLERALAPFLPRPHWGKLFELGPEALAAAYPRFADSAALIRRSDPGAVFGNAFLSRHLGVSAD
jgi:xylitol oxidase